MTERASKLWVQRGQWLIAALAVTGFLYLVAQSWLKPPLPAAAASLTLLSLPPPRPLPPARSPRPAAQAAKAKRALEEEADANAEEEGEGQGGYAKEMSKEYQAKQAELELDMWRQVEKSVLLQSLDHRWKEHLSTLDALRAVIHLRAYAQKTPINEYKREAFALFERMLVLIREDVTKILSHARN